MVSCSQYSQAFEKVDRLAIIATFQGKEQLLGVPEIPTFSGEQQSIALYQAVEKWCITEKKFKHITVIQHQVTQVK